MANLRIKGTKDHLKAAMRLVSRYSWLGDKTDELVELLFEDCKTDNQRELVTELFDRFLYITQTELSQTVRQFASMLVAIPGLTPANTIIVAMANDSSPDSSQSLLQYIKAPLDRLGWRDVKLINRADRVLKASRESEFLRTNIIVIDEFVGTGRTAIGKRNLIERTFNQAGHRATVFIRVLFSSSLGKENLKDAMVDFGYIQEIKRGVSDYDPPESIAPRLNLIKAIENTFSDECGTHRMAECSLGYGGTESLFAIENGNIPNSVFPILWWPERRDGKERKTLFTRYLGR